MAEPEKPWDSEPNDVDWIDDDTGYPCAIRRNPIFLTLGGYVGVPDDHPLYGQPLNARIKPPPEWLKRPVNIDEIGVMNIFFEAFGEGREEGAFSLSALIAAHGGLSYSDHDLPIAPPNPAATWWFGFDTCHAGDLSPYMDGLRHERFPEHIELFKSFETYRTVDFVRLICQGMAAQLKELEALGASLTIEPAD